MTDTQERTYEIDLGIDDWPMPLLIVYQKSVGVTAHYAAAAVNAALGAAGEDVAHFGEDGPPTDYVPPDLLNIPPQYLIGFVWMAERRKRPGLSFDELCHEIDIDTLMSAFLEAVTARMEAMETAPLPNRETRRATTPRSKSSSPSRKRSPAGAKPRSRTSPRTNGASSASSSKNSGEATETADLKRELERLAETD